MDENIDGSLPTLGEFGRTRRPVKLGALDDDGKTEGGSGRDGLLTKGAALTGVTIFGKGALDGGGAGFSSN
jgi:hypothetical protein